MRYNMLSRGATIPRRASNFAFCAQDSEPLCAISEMMLSRSATNPTQGEQHRHLHSFMSDFSNKMAQMRTPKNMCSGVCKIITDLLVQGGLFEQNAPSECAEQYLCQDVYNIVADLLVQGGLDACEATFLVIYTKG
jgi:hypothetical protein